MISLSKNHVHNIDNYKDHLTESSIIIFTKYINVISEYLKHCKDYIFIQNITYFKYILKRGINTINHVFKFLLIYTKNLEMVYYNCQKSYIYYVEFIGQIGDDNHSFLQLNSKDASLFVYKKTIFEINNDVRKEHILDPCSEKKIGEVNQLIIIYNNILFNLIENNSLINIITIVNTELSNIMNKILKWYIDNDSNKNQELLNNKIVALNIFSTYFKKDNLVEYLEFFVRKIKKLNKFNNNMLKSILMNNELLENHSTVNYINYIIKQITI